MKKQIFPIGKINKDVSPSMIDDAEVLSRVNLTVDSSESNSVGLNKPIKSTKLIGSFSELGNNVVIGECEDIERNQVFAFVYNDAQNHAIYRVTENSVTSLGIPSASLGFYEDEQIDAKIIDKYLIFTSPLNEPKKIDITEDLTSKTADQISLANVPPHKSPSVTLSNDETKYVNKLIGKSFQFSTIYKYGDSSFSTMSPYSELAVSPTMFTSADDTYKNNNYGNNVIVSYDTGGEDVSEVYLLAREGNDGSWFIINKEKRTSPSSSYVFYNNVDREANYIVGSEELFSDVPHAATSIEIAKNRVLLGGIKKGKDSITDNVTYELAYEEIDSSGGIISTPITVGDVNSDRYIQSTFFSSDKYKIGDKLNISFNGYLQQYSESDPSDNYHLEFEYNQQYIISQADIDAADPQHEILIKIRDSITAAIVAGEFLRNTSNIPPSLVLEAVEESAGILRVYFRNIYDPTKTQKDQINGSLVLSSISGGVSTLKSGSYYNVGRCFYDQFGRSNGVVSPTSIYVPFPKERDFSDAFSRAYLNFNIENDNSPSWAKYFRFAITPSVNFSGVFPFVSAGENIVDDYIDGRKVIAINMPRNFKYEYVNGDYMYLDVLDNESSPTEITDTIIKTIIGTRSSVEIGGELVAGNWMLVSKGDEDLSVYSGKLIYIYRDKKEVNTKIYFESSQTFNTGESSYSGVVGGEDAWFVNRKFEWDDAGTPSEKIVIVEDFSLNVNDNLRAYSKGRPVVHIENSKEKEYQDVVWSQNFIDNTNINGLSTFLPSNKVSFDEKNGKICRVGMAGDVLKVIQEKKETSIYLEKTRFVNPDGSVGIAKTNDFIGSVNSYNSTFGSSDFNSVVFEGRNTFYWDKNNAAVIRSGNNGQANISMVGMESRFKKILKNGYDNVVFGIDKKNNTLDVMFNASDNTTASFDIDGGYWEKEVEYVGGNGDTYDLSSSIASKKIFFGFNSAWIAEEGVGFLSFFNDEKTPKLEFIAKVSPDKNLKLNSIEQFSSVPMTTNIETEETATKPIGQATIIPEGAYKARNSSFVSPVFKNIKTTNGVDMSLIHEGDSVVGTYFKVSLTTMEPPVNDIRFGSIVCSFQSVD